VTTTSAGDAKLANDICQTADGESCIVDRQIGNLIFSRSPICSNQQVIFGFLNQMGQTFDTVMIRLAPMSGSPLCAGTNPPTPASGHKQTLAISACSGRAPRKKRIALSFAMVGAAPKSVTPLSLF
jgi:hypothetical protein